MTIGGLEPPAAARDAEPTRADASPGAPPAVTTEPPEPPTTADASSGTAAAKGDAHHADQPAPTARHPADRHGRTSRVTRRPGGRRLGMAAVTFLTGGRRRTPDAVEHLIRVHRVHHPKADFAALTRAYEVAEHSHRGQTRKSGGAYITHPLAVATILAELGADTTTLMAALLHDTVEDTELRLETVRETFGEAVAYLVDGVTKLEKVDFGDRAEAETIRKILVATGRDLRVTVIKLADRLHNMRTIRHKKRPSQIRTANVTRDIFIPLAERLGIHVLKAELEDIVFATLRPDEHAATDRAVAAAADRRDEVLGEFCAAVRKVLRHAGIEAEVTPRPRHHVSVARVQKRRGREELTPFELSRVMVVVDDDRLCYDALGVLHTCWTPVPGEFKDFIATPKFNLYQSLHTALSRPDGEVAEVLIRTRRMHRLAEFGVVAQTGDDGPDAPDQLAWLRRLLAWQKGIPDAHVFWSSLTADLSVDRELMVFTTEGRTLTLPAGSTCVDAAYAIGEQTGHHCIGAQINGRLVALSSVLADAETVSIITAPPGGAGPSAEWLSFVRSPLARSAIERWLEEHPQEARESVPAVPYGPSTPDAADAADTTATAEGTAERRRPRAASGPDASVSVPDLPDAPVRLARCCTPVPPDSLSGVVIRGGTVAVHQADCHNVARMRSAGRDVLAAAWLPGQAESGYRVTVQLEALDRPRLLADVTATIDAAGADITSASISPPQQMRVQHVWTIQLPDVAALPRLLRSLRRVQGVYDVYRARPGTERGRAGEQ